MDPREGEGTTDSAARGSHKGGWTSLRGRKLFCDKEPVGGGGGASCGLSREAAEVGRGVCGGAMSEELIGQRRCPLIGRCSCHSVAAPPSAWSLPPTRWWSGPWRILVPYACTWDSLTSLFESQGDRVPFRRGTTEKRGQGRVLGALESGAQY